MKFEKIKGSQNHHLFRPIRADGTVSETYWVRFYRQGKGRLEESLKTGHLGEAREKRDVRIAEFLGQKPRSGPRHLLVEDKFPEFLELKRGKAHNTFVSMETQWRLHLQPYFGCMTIESVSESEWIRYVQEKRRESPERKFFNDRKYLSMFLNWLHRDGLIQRIPKFEDVDPERTAGKVFTSKEVTDLLRHAAEPLHMQILMALTMGMRIGEILSLEWDQVDWKAQTIHLPAHKTKIRKSRSFAISDAVFGPLQFLFRLSGSKSPWVFPSPDDDNKSVGKGGNRTAWETCRSKSGVTGRFHDLRHTFLTHAFKKSVNPALICHFAGLSLEEAQKTYLHFDHNDTRIVASLMEVRS